MILNYNIKTILKECARLSKYLIFSMVLTAVIGGLVNEVIEGEEESVTTFTTICVMPLDDDFKQDMDQMTEKEKEVMLIWFKALNEKDK